MRYHQFHQRGPLSLSIPLSTVHATTHGYPKLAAFLDSDENFMVYRRFSYLQARLLLEKQNELQKLELELEAMDEEAVDGEGNETALMTRSQYPPERLELMAHIERKWLEHCSSRPKPQPSLFPLLPSKQLCHRTQPNPSPAPK